MYAQAATVLAVVVAWPRGLVLQTLQALPVPPTKCGGTGGRMRSAHGRGAGLDERQERVVDLAGVGPLDGVRAARDDDELQIVGELAHALGRLLKRQHLIGVAVD